MHTFAKDSVTGLYQIIFDDGTNKPTLMFQTALLLDAASIVGALNGGHGLSNEARNCLTEATELL